MVALLPRAVALMWSNGIRVDQEEEYMSENHASGGRDGSVDDTDCSSTILDHMIVWFGSKDTIARLGSSKASKTTRLTSLVTCRLLPNTLAAI